MDDRQILHQQQQIRDLKKQLDQARHDAEDWRVRAEAIQGDYLELSDQILRGDFVKAKHVRLAK